MTGATCWLSAARLACTLCTGSVDALLSTLLALAVAFASEEAAVGKLMPGEGIAAASRDEGVICDVELAATDELLSGPHAPSDIVASATKVAINGLASAVLAMLTVERILMCASIRWG